MFNRYAFCYVAIYSLDFQGASKSVVKMFGERGWTALINDDIVDVVLTMVITCFLSYMFSLICF